MPDIARVKDPNIGIAGDMYLEMASFDLAVESLEDQCAYDELIELFDMTPADDLDYPELFSDQRASDHSDTNEEKRKRVKNAAALLNKIPGIDPENSKVSLDNNGQIIIDLKTKK